SIADQFAKRFFLPVRPICARFIPALLSGKDNHDADQTEKRKQQTDERCLWLARESISHCPDLQHRQKGHLRTRNVRRPIRRVLSEVLPEPPWQRNQQT